MPRLAEALEEVGAADLSSLPLRPRHHLGHPLQFEDAAPVAFHGRAAWRHVRGGGGAGFLDSAALPTSLLVQRLATVPNSGSEASPFSHDFAIAHGVADGGIARGTSLEARAHHAIIEALASSPILAAHAAIGGAKLALPTAFDDCGPVMGNCHSRYVGNAHYDHTYMVDTKPLSIKRLLRMAFAGATALAEDAGMTSAGMLSALALLAIWAPYDKLIPSLSMSLPTVPKMIASPFGAIGGGFASIGAGFTSMGRGLGKGVKSAGKGFKAVGSGLGKGFKAAGKGIAAGGKMMIKGVAKGGKMMVKGVAKGGKLLAAGIVLGAVALGKVAKMSGKMIAKGAVLGANLIKGAAKALWKGTKLLGKGLVAGAKLAYKGAKFAGKMVAKGAKLAWKGMKAAGRMAAKASKAAYKATKFLAKGIAKGAVLAAKGLVKMGSMLNNGVKALGRGILGAGGLKGATTALLLAGGIVLVAGVALMALQRRGGRSRGGGIFGSSSARGKRGRRERGGARQRAAQLAAEREAARSRENGKKKRKSPEDEAALLAPKKHRLINDADIYPSKKRSRDTTLEDFMADQHAGINGRHGLAAAAVAAGGGAMIAHQMGGGQKTRANAMGEDLQSGSVETLGDNTGPQPGRVVLGRGRHAHQVTREDPNNPVDVEEPRVNKRTAKRFGRHAPGPPADDDPTPGQEGYTPHHPSAKPPPLVSPEEQAQQNAEEDKAITEKAAAEGDIENGRTEGQATAITEQAKAEGYQASAKVDGDTENGKTEEQSEAISEQANAKGYQASVKVERDIENGKTEEQAEAISEQANAKGYQASAKVERSTENGKTEEQAEAISEEAKADGDQESGMTSASGQAGEETDPKPEVKIDESQALGTTADHFAGQDIHKLTAKLAADKRAMRMYTNQINAGEQYAEVMSGQNEVSRNEAAQRELSEVRGVVDDTGMVHGDRVGLGALPPSERPMATQHRGGRTGPSTPGNMHGLRVHSPLTPSPVRGPVIIQNEGTPAFPVYHSQGTARQLSEIDRQDESNEYSLTPRHRSPPAVSTSPGSSRNSCANQTGSFRRACGVGQAAEMQAEQELHRALKSADDGKPEMGRRHLQLEQRERDISNMQNLREANLPANKRPPRQQEAFPEVGAARRMHHAGELNFATVRDMDADNFQRFKAKVDLRGHPQDVVSAPGHGKHHGHVHVVTSGLQIELHSRSLLAARRASAFFETASGQCDEAIFPIVSASADVSSGGVDGAVNEDALFPLYYLDNDGQARDFLEPPPLKNACRRLAAGSPAIGSDFFGTPVPRHRLASRRN